MPIWNFAFKNCNFKKIDFEVRTLFNNDDNIFK